MSKPKEDDMKIASNFELNVMNLGKHRFQLVKGDRFTSNGNNFMYQPSTAENKGKGHYRRFSGRTDGVSALKYKKDVLRADNIKLVVDRPLSSNEPPDSEYNVHNRWREWEVQYAYVQPIDKAPPLVVMVVELGWMSKQWEYKITEVEIERQTKELIFLKLHHPVHYRSKIERNELNKVYTAKEGTQYHVCGIMDDYNENEIVLWEQVEKNQREKIESAKKLVIDENKHLDNVLKLKTKQGFAITKTK